MRWQPINSRWHFDWRFNCQYVIVSQYINLVPAGRQTVPTNAKFYDTILRHQGAVSIRKTVLPGMAIPMSKIRRPNGRLIFNMQIAIRR